MKMTKTEIIWDCTDPYLNATGGDYDEWIQYFVSNDGRELFAYRSSCDADVCCATGKFCDTFSVYCEGQNFPIDELEIYRRFKNTSPHNRYMEASADELIKLLNDLRNGDENIKYRNIV